jgi:hypothetical protein
MAEETEEVSPLPSTGDGLPADIELKDVIEKLAYRIEEMEKKMEEMGKMKMEEETKKEEDVEMEEDEEDLPKLNGAPIEVKMASVEINRRNYGKKVMNTQDSFLSKFPAKLASTNTLSIHPTLSLVLFAIPYRLGCF